MNLQNSPSRKISNIEETKAKIQAVLDKIRPSLLADGGGCRNRQFNPRWTPHHIPFGGLWRVFNGQYDHAKWYRTGG